MTVPLQHQLSKKKRRKKPLYFFFFLLANYLQKAQHCLNNKKAFTDGHKSICSETILMNIYSHQFSWQLNFLQTFLQVNTQTVSKKQIKRFCTSTQERSQIIYFAALYRNLTQNKKPSCVQLFRCTDEKLPPSWRAWSNCTKNDMILSSFYRWGTDVDHNGEACPKLDNKWQNHRIKLYSLWILILARCSDLDTFYQAVI